MQEIKVSSFPWESLAPDGLSDVVLKTAVLMDYKPADVLERMFQDVDNNLPDVQVDEWGELPDFGWDGVIVCNGILYLSDAVLNAVGDDFLNRLNEHDPSAYATLLFALGYEMVVGYDKHQRVTSFKDAEYLLFGSREDFYRSGGILSQE